MNITADLVGRPNVVNRITSVLATDVSERDDYDFIAANATPGMIYGWQMEADMEEITGRETPFVYVRESAKKGGHKERITGGNSIQQGQRALIVESEYDPEAFLRKVHSSAEALVGAGYKPMRVATSLLGFVGILGILACRSRL